MSCAELRLKLLLWHDILVAMKIGILGDQCTNMHTQIHYLMASLSSRFSWACCIKNSMPFFFFLQCQGTNRVGFFRNSVKKFSHYRCLLGLEVCENLIVLSVELWEVVYEPNVSNFLSSILLGQQSKKLLSSIFFALCKWLFFEIYLSSIIIYCFSILLIF